MVRKGQYKSNNLATLHRHRSPKKKPEPKSPTGALNHHNQNTRTLIQLIQELSPPATHKAVKSMIPIMSSCFEYYLVCEILTWVVKQFKQNIIRFFINKAVYFYFKII